MSPAGGDGDGARRRLLPMLIVGNGIIGGMEEYVLSLVRHFRVRGQRTLVAAPFVGEFTAALLEQGHPARDLHILDMSDHIDVGALAQLSTFLKARKVSLVHTHLRPADTLGAAAAAHAGIPALSTLHGLDRCKEELLLRDLYGIEYVAVSEAGRASALAKGVPPDAVQVIPNGVDPQRFDPRRFDREAVRRALGLGAEDVLVICVSRLSREKYPEGFMQVAELATAADPRLVFALVGTGPLDSQLRQTLARLGNPRIRLLGARRDIPELLAASDIAALTSRTESLPFSVLEAMAMELPVVAHDVGGVREALGHGAEGFLVPFGRRKSFAARVLALAADPALRRRMGEAGRRKTRETFNFDRTAEALLGLYGALVARHGAKALAERAPARSALDGSTSVGSPRPRAATFVENGTAASPPPARRSLRDHPENLRESRERALSVTDAHLHLSGGERCDEVLATLDAAGVARACLIAPFIDTRTWVPATGTALRAANERLLDIVGQAPERLWGLVAVDPLDESAAARVAEYGAVEGVRGLKMIPHGWSPGERAALEVYEAAEAAGLPILFHSGIFISGRSSDLCRPALFECVRRFPRLRVVLAHLGWPWVDEAIAVAFMDILKGLPPQILLDTSPGTPPIYRRGALRKAYAVLGARALVFGSDRFLPADPSVISNQLARDRDAFRSLGAGREELARIFGANARELFGPSARDDPPALHREMLRAALEPPVTIP